MISFAPRLRGGSPIAGPRRRSSVRMCWVSSKPTLTIRSLVIVVFDLDDFDAAIAELDARYLAGEAAAHARTRSLIARAYNGFKRTARSPRRLEDWGYFPHRHAAAMPPGEGVRTFRSCGARCGPATFTSRPSPAERPRSGLQPPLGKWDPARGLRRRVANGRHHDG